MESLTIRPFELEAWAHWLLVPGENPRVLLSWVCSELPRTVLTIAFVNVCFNLKAFLYSAFPSGYGPNFSSFSPSLPPFFLFFNFILLFFFM